MEEQKALPLIFNMKAAKILKYRVAACYKVEENNPNVLRCIMPVGKDRYVDLLKGKEVSMLSIQVLADEAGKEDTNLLTGLKIENQFGQLVKDGDFIDLGSNLFVGGADFAETDEPIVADKVKQTRKNTTAKTQKRKK